MKIGFYYDFRPVGQGLFSLGRLSCIKSDGAMDQFMWVHDCGSKTLTSSAMTREIDSLRNDANRPTLDLLILSHFDEDHISGLILLLSVFRVRRLVLPYYTPAERLLIFLSQGERVALLGRFLAGPVAFIRSYEGGQETQILFVGKSNEDPSPDSTITDGPTEDPVNVGGLDKANREEIEIDPDFRQAALSHSTLMINGSIPLTVWGHWEFCFYNLPQPSDKLDELWVKIQPEFDHFFTQTQNGENSEPTIQKMKRIYRDVFGTSAAGRNDISLVTYTGPALSGLGGAGIAAPPLTPLYPSSNTTRPLLVVQEDPGRLRFIWSINLSWHTYYIGSKPSLLYTGDIRLNENRVEEIKRLLTPVRWDAIQVLQVPHHGAASSWTAGLADKFDHVYSVFSSARYHPTYLHPREEVLADLKDTACVLVNEFTGAVFHGGARW